jgi:hypothetical protein
VSERPELSALLEAAVSSGHDDPLRQLLLSSSHLPGPRLNLGVVRELASAAGALAATGVGADGLEALLDGWAAMGEDDAPGDQPAVILPCAAVAAYAEVATRRPEWWDDETAKLRRAAADGRWRVREVVAAALQRLLATDWVRALAELEPWASDPDPLVVRAAAAGVAEPGLLDTALRAAQATDVQRLAVESFRNLAPPARRSPDGRALRQALGYTLSVAAAASRDTSLLEELAATDDGDLRWIVAQNLRKRRLAPLADRLDPAR